jgi:alpha-galactosidase
LTDFSSTTMGWASSSFPLFVVLVAFLFPIHVQALNNGLGRTPPMGWSTWCTDNFIIPCYDDFCNEKEIKSVADAMATNGLRDLGYKYVLLDDCWAGPRDKNGNVTADPTRFPSGMKALADYVHSRGLLLGLYTDVGETTCRGGRPGSWPHYQQDAWTYAHWGIDYVKMDWCHHPWNYTAEALYGMMRDALNKTGRPMFFSVCEWGLYEPWTWGMKTANSWRVGPDHLPLWWTPPLGQDPGQGQGTANVIEHMAGLSSYAAPGGWNDPDFLMTGEWWMSETDWQTEFSFWCLFAAPLIVATDVREMSNKQVLLNKEAIAVNQDPLGKPGDRYANYSNGGQVWSKPLSDNSWAVILYNSNFLEWIDVTAIWQQHLPGWPKKSTKAKVRDIWQHQDLGVFAYNYTSYWLEPHAVTMLRVYPA